MTKTTVPLCLGWFGDVKGALFIGGEQGRNKWIKATNATPSMKNLSRDLILDQKEVRMKLEENTIIESKAMNG
jgi:hypothetical protein